MDNLEGKQSSKNVVSGVWQGMDMSEFVFVGTPSSRDAISPRSPYCDICYCHEQRNVTMIIAWEWYYSHSILHWMKFIICRVIVHIVLFFFWGIVWPNKYNVVGDVFWHPKSLHTLSKKLECSISSSYNLKSNDLSLKFEQKIEETLTLKRASVHFLDDG